MQERQSKMAPRLPGADVKEKDDINNVHNSQLASYLCQVCHECNTLHCLPKSHLVSQNPIDALVIEVSQPIHAFELILLQRPIKDLGLGDLPVRLQHGCGQTEVLVDCIYRQTEFLPTSI